MLAAALLLSVTSMSAISMFAERIEGALNIESSRLLGAERILESRAPVANQWLDKATTLQLERADGLVFQSMVYTPENLRLATVKAVTGNYPLRGYFVVKTDYDSPEQRFNHGPPAGHVWLEEALLQALELNPGESLGIGNATLKIAGILINEPNRGLSGAGLGYRALMHMADVPSTEVVQPGSRLRYEYLFAGDLTALALFSDYITPRLEQGQNWLGQGEGRPTIDEAMSRAKIFLLLSGALVVLLAAAAMVLVVGAYANRQASYVAILRVLGATTGDIRRLYLVQLSVLAVIFIPLGWLLGWLMHEVVLSLVQTLLPPELGTLSYFPFTISAVTGVIVLMAFAAPTLLNLSRLEVMAVLRQETVTAFLRSWWAYIIGCVFLLGCVWLYTGNLWIALVVLLCILFVSLVAAFIAFGLHHLYLPPSGTSMVRMGLASLRRRTFLTALQVAALALIIGMLLALQLMRTTLIEEWRTQLPSGRPDHFLINISPSDVDAVTTTLDRAGVEPEGLYPLIYGRLTTINGTPLKIVKGDKTDLDRDYGLTWSATLPEDNQLLNGYWWPTTPAPPEEEIDYTEGEQGSADQVRQGSVSLEESFANELGVKVGDRLGFLIGDQQVNAEITSLRRLDWRVMRPNFFMIFSPGTLDPFAATWMTSFMLPQENTNLLSTLVRHFPSVVLIDLSRVVGEIRLVLDQVTLVLTWLVAIMLVSWRAVVGGCSAIKYGRTPL